MVVAAIDPMDPASLLRAFGLIGCFVVLFAETGLLIGFFLPGDTLLFIAGVGAGGASAQLTGVTLPLPALLVGAPIAAAAGSQTGYMLGRVAGRRLFYSRHHKKMKRPEAFFAQYGYAKAIFLSRFVGIVRTAIPPTAGALGVSPRRFWLLNILSAVLRRWDLHHVLTTGQVQAGSTS
jgi:membrane-associated protein